MSYMHLDRETRMDMILDRKTYTPINGKAYTQDGHLVYTIFLQISPYADAHDEEIVWKGLETFEIESVENLYLLAYLITFVKAEDAFQVLFQHGRNRVVNDFNWHQVKVTAAQTWQQPFSEKFIRIRFEIYTDPNECEELPIWKLNDDCLIHVNSYLALREQYFMSRLCTRFENVFNCEFKRKRKHIVIEAGSEYSELTLLEWREILKQYGHLAETIKMIEIGIDEIVNEFISLYCFNLKSLEIKFSGWCTCTFFENIQHFKQIHTIKLIAVNLKEHHLEYLLRISSLEILDLSRSDIEGLSLDGFKNLKELNIESCIKMPPSAFISMCGKLSKLTALNIKNCLKILDDEIQEMSSLCQNVRELSIDNRWARNIKPILQLPNLEKLYFSIRRPVTDYLFLELANKLKTKLRVLKIYCETSRDIPPIPRHQLTWTQMKCICELTALEELILWDTRINEKFLRSMLSLPSLKHLEAVFCHSMSGLNPGAMLDFIRDAPKLEKLTLVFKWIYYSDFILSTKEVLMQRRSKWGKAFVLYVPSWTYSKLNKDCKEYIRSHRDIITVLEIPSHYLIF